MVTIQCLTMPINQAFSTIFSIQFPSSIQESGFCWPLSLRMSTPRNMLNFGKIFKFWFFD